MTQADSISPNNLLPEGFLSDCRTAFPHARISAVLLSLTVIRDDKSVMTHYRHLLNRSEQTAFSHYSLEKRRVEWLGGRVCAKLALASQLSAKHAVNPGEITIDNSKSGRPFATTPLSTVPIGKYDISISHSGDFACALAADTFCGIDLQYPKETLLRVYDRFCWPTEEKILIECSGFTSRLTCLTQLWSAKEAIRKACSHTFIPEFLHLRLTHMHTLPHGSLLHFSHDRFETAAVCSFHENYGLAVCLFKEPRHA